MKSEEKIRSRLKQLSKKRKKFFDKWKKIAGSHHDEAAELDRILIPIEQKISVLRWVLKS